MLALEAQLTDLLGEAGFCCCAVNSISSLYHSSGGLRYPRPSHFPSIRHTEINRTAQVLTPKIVVHSIRTLRWQIQNFARPSGTAIHTHSLRGWMLELERFTGSWSWREGEMDCCFACTGRATLRSMSMASPAQRLSSAAGRLIQHWQWPGRLTLHHSSRRGRFHLTHGRWGQPLIQIRSWPSGAGRS